MKFGPRKLAALAVLIVVVIAGVAIWYWLGTAGLLGVLIAVSVGGFLGVAWLIIQMGRRTRTALAELGKRIDDLRKARPIGQEDFTSLLEEIRHSGTMDGELVDRILTGVHLRLTRAEALNEAAIRDLARRLDALGRDVRP